MGINRSFFLDYLGETLYRKGMTQAQEEGHDALLNYWEQHHAAKDDRWLAYILATAFHETGRVMQPVLENLNYSAERLLVVFPRYFTPEQARQSGVGPGTVRLSVGLEDVGDLIADIDQALQS